MVLVFLGCFDLCGVDVSRGEKSGDWSRILYVLPVSKELRSCVFLEEKLCELHLVQCQEQLDSARNSYCCSPTL